MYNSREIAERALVRAEEIKTEKRAGRKRLSFAGAMFCVCAAVVLTTITKSPTTAVIPDNEPVPLAEFPFLSEDPTSGFGSDPAFLIPEFTGVTVPANAKDAKTDLRNPEGNSRHFIFEILLKDTGERLYLSEPVAPGSGIEDITLAGPLPSGEYEAVLIIRAFAPDEPDAEISLGAEITVTVV